ncbi:MAG TPA: hypothetical protein VF384_05835 [Planctomycetota bacterium]
MKELTDRKVPLGVFLGIAVLSASLLAFQVLLTRVCALRLHFHFGFLVISNSLLGIGASGTVLTLLEARWRRNPGFWIWLFTFAYVASLGFTWWFARVMPVPDTLEFGWTDAEQAKFLRFAVFNLGIAVPFFFGGGAVGLMLSAYAHRINAVYASDLLGAGVGCLLCPLLLWPLGAGGCLMAVAILGAVTLALVAPRSLRAVSVGLAVVAAIGLGAWMPSFDAQFPVPGKSHLKITQGERLDLQQLHEFSRWSANSRIDVIRSPLPFWFAFGLGALDRDAAIDPKKRLELGQQKWIMQDGDAGTFLTDLSHAELGRQFLLRTLYGLSASIKRGSAPRVFVIGVGGGHDVWAHKAAGASFVKGVELNRGVLEAHRTIAREFSQGLLEDPNIELVCDEGRSALMRDPGRYDVIQMTGIDTWTSLASGAYVLAENYLYTVEAVQLMYEHLQEGGMLQITRMGANMERLRLLANVHQAFTNMGVADLAASVALVTAPLDGLTSVLVKRGVFTEAEVAAIEAFADKAGHLKSYLPLRKPPEDVVTTFLATNDKAAFIRDFPRRITPTTDDQPYFFNFTRWDSPPDEAKQWLAEATSVSQGNPLFLWGQLGFSTLVALLLIVVPLWWKRGAARGRHVGRFLVYFAGIGGGFIFIEIALMQKFTLLLGQPLYSIVVTLFSILIFTGLGSFLSGPWLRGGRGRARAIPAGIAVAALCFVLFGTPIVDLVIGQPLAVRAAVAAAMIAPMALLLGMPFAHGIGLLHRENPQFVPWAWAVNGCATVVGSVVTVVVSMNFGFHCVLLIAAGIYAVAFLALDRLAR